MKQESIAPRYGWWPRILDQDAACAYLAISRKTLTRYVAEGKIETGKFEAPESDERLLDKVLFDRLHLDRFVERYFR